MSYRCYIYVIKDGWVHDYHDLGGNGAQAAIAKMDFLEYIDGLDTCSYKVVNREAFITYINKKFPGADIYESRKMFDYTDAITNINLIDLLRDKEVELQVVIS